MNIQMQSNKMVDGDVTPVPISEAEFYSLYIGVPGDYEWLADFADIEWARPFGKMMAQGCGCTYRENLTGA
mgnify:CR=1 FL=1